MSRCDVGRIQHDVRSGGGYWSEHAQHQSQRHRRRPLPYNVRSLHLASSTRWPHSAVRSELAGVRRTVPSGAVSGGCDLDFQKRREIRAAEPRPTLRRKASRSPLEVGEELLSVLMSSVHLCSGVCRNPTEQYGKIYTAAGATDEIVSRNSGGAKLMSCEFMQSPGNCANMNDVSVIRVWKRCRFEGLTYESL